MARKTKAELIAHIMELNRELATTIRERDQKTSMCDILRTARDDADSVRLSAIAATTRGDNLNKKLTEATAELALRTSERNHYRTSAGVWEMAHKALIKTISPYEA